MNTFLAFITAVGVMSSHHAPVSTISTASTVSPYTYIIAGATTNVTSITNAAAYLQKFDFGQSRLGSQYLFNTLSNYTLSSCVYLGTSPANLAGISWGGIIENASVVLRHTDAFGTVFGVSSTVPMTITTNQTFAYQPTSYTNASLFCNFALTNYLSFYSNKTANVFQSYSPPTTFIRNTNWILYGLHGMTSFAPYAVNSNGVIGVPSTLLSRRLVYIRGHSTGTTGLGVVNSLQGYKCYFVDATNGIYVATVTNSIGQGPDNPVNTNYYRGGDYNILCLNADVPANIEAAWMLNYSDFVLGGRWLPTDTTATYYTFMGLFCEIYGPSCFTYYGGPSPRSVTITDSLQGSSFISGDSGSPDYFPIATTNGTYLAFAFGTTTTGYTTNMQADINALLTFNGLSTNNAAYQPYVFPVTNFPVFNY